MDRDPLKINRVPTVLAWELAKTLEKTIKFDSIYFAKAKDPLAPRWKIFDINRPDGTINPDFKNIKLRFRASTGLKNLYRHAFKVTEEFFQFADISVSSNYRPEEVGWAPYALALAPNYEKTGHWLKTWPMMLPFHLSHWHYNQDARKYAADDIHYTRRLYKEEFGAPEPGDVDSDLAAMTANCRWHGFAIDVEKMVDLKRDCLKKLGFADEIAEVYKTKMVTPEVIARFGRAVMAAAPSKRYLMQVMSPVEKLAFQTGNKSQGSTKRMVLEEIATWTDDDDETKFHPAAIRSQEILAARKAKKEIEVYEKLILARRFHASFKVIGTLSSRMSGDNGLNAQGINHAKTIRSAFPLADSSIKVIKEATRYSDEVIERLVDSGELQITKLSGGDFKSFEVSLAARVFDDAKLNEFLTKGGKIHAIFAMRLFPGKTYEEILATDGAKNTRDLYDVGKKCLFAIFYGAEAFTLMDRQNIPEEIAVSAVSWLQKEYRGIGLFGEKIKDDFGALSQPNGIGTKVEWRDPKEYVESFLGFKRYFTLENRVMKALFHLAQNVPQEWRSLKVKVHRREGKIQTPGGAVSSALYGASFGIMSRTIRAAKNHAIQSPGAEITKATQHNIWSLQPHGVNPWIVECFNVHDELMCAIADGYGDAVETKAKETVAKFKKIVPHLAIDWLKGIPSWGQKKGL